MKHLHLGYLAVLACCAGSLSAGTLCPSVTPNPGITDPSGCNSTITITNAGTSIVTLDLHPYEFSEDQLVGVVNNSSSVVTKIPLAGSDIFGFDGDGICAGGYIAASSCTTGDSTGYGPNGVTFTTPSVNSGTVNISPGIAANGGTAFFSLEEAPGAGGITAGAPEPGTLGMLALGLFGVAGWARKRNKKSTV